MVLSTATSRCRISPSYSNNPNTLAEVSWIHGDTIWRGHFYADRCTLNGFIMTACAPRLCCLSISPLSVFGSSRWFRTKRQRRHSRPLFFYPLHFFVIFKLIDYLSEKYVSYLSNVSPTRSSHTNCVEDSLSLSFTLSLFYSAHTLQSALVSLPMYQPTEWKYYLKNILSVESHSLSRTHLLSAYAGKYHVSR